MKRSALAWCLGALLAGGALPAYAQPQIFIGGNCPGTIQISWRECPPSTPMRFLLSSSPGAFVVPIPPCTGTVLGLAAPVTIVSPPLPMNTGPFGVGGVSGPVGPGACGRYLQLIVLTSPCITSNVEQIP